MIKKLNSIPFNVQVKSTEKNSIVIAQKLSSECVLNSEIFYLDTLEITYKPENSPFYAIMKTSIVSNHDASKILITDNDFEAKEKMNFTYKVFDNELKLTYKKQVALPLSKGKFFMRTSLNLDSKGDVYVLGMFLSDISGNKENMMKYVAIYSKKGNQNTVVQDIVLSEKKIKTLTFVNDEKRNRLVIGGLYSNKTSGTDGCFFIICNNESLLTTETNLKEFSTNFINENGHFNNQNGESQFLLDNLLIKENGELILSGELFYTSDVRYNNGGPINFFGSIRYQHDILVVSSDAKGKVNWYKKFPKECIHEERPSYKAQYLVVLKDDKVFIIFLEDNKYVTSLQEHSISPVKHFANKYTPVLVSIDTKGNVQKNRFFSDPKNKQYIECHLNFKSSLSKDIFTWHWNKKNFIYGKISIE